MNYKKKMIIASALAVPFLAMGDETNKVSTIEDLAVLPPADFAITDYVNTNKVFGLTEHKITGGPVAYGDTIVLQGAPTLNDQFTPLKSQVVSTGVTNIVMSTFGDANKFFKLTKESDERALSMTNEYAGLVQNLTATNAPTYK